MPLDAWIEAHRTDPTREVYWLVALGFPVVQYLTTCPDPITYGGHVYSPAVLTVGGIVSDSTGAANASGGLTIGAGDDYWPALVAALTEDQRYPTVLLYEAWMDTTVVSLTPAAVRAYAALKVSGAKVTPTEVRFDLGPVADPALARLPFREYGGALCTYRLFKGVQCAYAGATTACDRTYVTCTGLANQARFGGFLALPSMEELTLTWQWQSGETLYEESLTLTRRDA
ncbi:MAG: hypothetical protein Q8P41_31640 [Pseudomonadota bacterium]|nr:hypothetical protein [Pseudomonadota bacterium]